MHQYNINHGDTPKLSPTDPPFRPLPHGSPCQQHQHLFQTRKPDVLTTPRPSVETPGSKTEFPSITAQQENLQEFLSEFYNLGKIQHIGYNFPQVTTTYEGVETVITHPPQDLHSASDVLAALVNPSTTSTASIISTTALTSSLYEYTPIFLDYDPYLILSML